MYVVGFVGDDATLGRTFLCADETEAKKAYTILVDENKEKEWFWDFKRLNEYSVQGTFNGLYFMGQLESP